MKTPGARQRPHAYLPERGDVYIIALVAAVFFVWLGRIELLGPDEARHSEIGREMLVNRSFLLPRLHGEPYYDKPAAYYWLVASSLAAFGVNEFAARLPAVVAALMTIASAVRFATRAYSNCVGRLVAVGLASTPAFVVLGRYGILDMPLTAVLTAAFTSLGTWWLERRTRPPYAFYFFIGVATLIKGPVAILQAAVAIAALLVWSARDPTRSPRRTIDALTPICGALLVLVVALPWYAAAAIAYPDYITTFLLRHNLERFFAIGPGTHHAQAWWFYPAIAPALLLPWTPWVAAGVADLRLPSSRNGKDADVFCAIWAGSLSLVYLLARSKNATYLLPAMVPLVCLAGAALERRFTAVGPIAVRNERALRRCAIVVATFVATATASGCLYVLAEYPGLHARLWWALPAVIVLPIAIYRPRIAAPRRTATTIVMTMLALFMATYGAAGDVIGEIKGMRALARVIETDLPATTTLWSFRSSQHAATFYTAKLMPRLGTREALIAVLTAESPVAVIIGARTLNEFGADLPSGVFARWSSHGGTVLLSNVAPPRPALGNDLEP